MRKTAKVIVFAIAGYTFMHLYLALSALPPTTVPVTRSNEVVAEPSSSNVISLVNRERAIRGIAPLRELPVLNESAKSKADDLVEYTYFDHTNPYTGADGTSHAFNLLEYGQCSNVGENLARGVSSPGETVRAWLDSPTHRELLLHPQYDLTGVAIVNNYGSDGGYIVVQHFCDVE